MGEYDFNWGQDAGNMDYDYSGGQGYDIQDDQTGMGYAGGSGWGDMQGGGGGQWPSMDMGGMDVQQQMALPQYEMTNPGSQWTPSSMSEPQAATPTVGQAGPGAKTDDDSWMKQLGKAGIGMGVGIGTSLAGKGIEAMFAPKAAKTSMPAPPSAAQYTPEPLEPRQGTLASPLLSKGPTQVKGSQGLKEKKPTYGGFSMY